jgi:hypothetical protein
MNILPDIILKADRYPQKPDSDKDAAYQLNFGQSVD